MIDIKVIINNEEFILTHDPSENILETLKRHNISLISPCGGNGTCGKCKIQVVHTGVPNPSIKEKDIRLACRTYTSEPITILLNNKEKNYHIEMGYIKNAAAFNPSLKKHAIYFKRESMEKLNSLTNYINSLISKKLSHSHGTLLKLSKYLNEGLYNTALYVIEKAGNVYDVQREDVPLYGIAIDIGTTTIAMALIDLENPKVLDTCSLLNSQKKYGHDVISRIQYASKSEDNLKAVSQTIKEDLLRGMLNLVDKHNISRDYIYDVCISANTTMVQLLLGFPSLPLAVAPFTMVTGDILEFDYKEIFNSSVFKSRVFITPGISAYVGGDIVSGILNTKMYSSEDISLLIDIGTNGEMALGNSDRILCAATAAGPAFEGATIKHGMGSVEGAISRVSIENNRVMYETIGDKRPIGVCGSGIIDMVSELLRNDFIYETGQFNEDITDDEGNFLIANSDTCEKIVFTQRDVREIQLAKSALRSGIEILIKEFGCSCEDIKNVYLAGGFGNKIRIDSAAGIGLIPNELKNKIVLAGNSSLGGSIDLILNESLGNDLMDIITITKYIELSSNPEFNRLFVEHMIF